MAKDPTRKNRMTRLAKLVDPMIEPGVRARGFVMARLISEWPQIMGDMSAWCRPAEMKFAKGETNNGTLKLSVASGRGPEATQMTATIIDRVNAAFGYAAVSRITIVQNLLPASQQAVRPPQKKMDKPTSESGRNEQIWALDERLQGVQSPELRAALRRLGTPLDD